MPYEIDLRKEITDSLNWIRRIGPHEEQGLEVAINEESARVTIDGTTTLIVDRRNLPAAWDTPINVTKLRTELATASIGQRPEETSGSSYLQSLRNQLTTPRASQSFNVAQAREHLTTEARRLRSGAGGYGGLSPKALSLADAIHRVLNTTTSPGGPLEATVLLTAEVQRLRSGAGGYGGRSPEALCLADAIDCLLDLHGGGS